jgi:hypothetical protein
MLKYDAVVKKGGPQYANLEYGWCFQFSRFVNLGFVTFSPTIYFAYLWIGNSKVHDYLSKHNKAGEGLSTFLYFTE